MENYKFEYVNNHPIVGIDGRSYIIDTGSPISFFMGGGQSIVLTINGRSFNLRNNPLQVSREDVEALVGKTINGFIGLDILSEMGSLYMNRNSGDAAFGNAEAYNLENNAELRRKTVAGMSILEMQIGVNGVMLPAIIDSGACISYASNDLVTGGRFAGEVYDYSPTFGGDIETEKYEIDLSVCGKNHPAEIAKMTTTIERSLGMLGYKAIIGFGEIRWSELLIDITGHKFSYT